MELRHGGHRGHVTNVRARARSGPSLQAFGLSGPSIAMLQAVCVVPVAR